jgi:putative flippase GtrA
VNTAVDFAVFNVIVLTASDYSEAFAVFANLAAFSVALPVGYVLNSLFTFHAPLGRTGFVKYVAVTVSGRVIYIGAIFALILLLEPADIVAMNAVKAGAIVVALAWTFIGYRYYALRRTDEAPVS